MSFIRKSALAAALLLAPQIAGGVAHAADLPIFKDPTPLREEPEVNWEGGYAGVFAGAMALRTTATEVATLPDDPTSCAPAGTAGVPAGMYFCNVNGQPHYTKTPTPAFNLIGDKWGGRQHMGTVGITAGYNIQRGAFVYGAEFDYGVMLARKDHSYGPSPASVDDTMLHTRPGEYMTARIRMGYAFGRFLPFVTAGVAAARVNAWVDDPDMALGIQTQQTATSFGYVVGAGLEYMFSKHITLKAEYQHMGFAGSRVEGYVNVTCTPGSCPPQWKLDRVGMALEGIAAWKINNTVDLVRVGMNYKF